MKKEYNAKEKYSYLIGQIIGKWKVLDIVHTRKKPDAICFCTECGNTTRPVNIGNLLKGLTHDCGCGRKKTLSKMFGKDFTGQKFGKLTAVELMPETNKYHKRIYRCICDCGNETYVLGNSLATKHTQSCGCINSVFNMYIRQYLDSQQINNIPEYSVIINNIRYRFDFYLPSYNLFIEYDGIQHFEPKGFSGDKDVDQLNFEKTQQRDKIKNQYAKDNKINLLRIPYWEQNNIDNIIDNCLQRLNEGESVFTDYATV